MQVLYEEMESSLASSLYEVVGYFDIKPDEPFPPNCSYLGNPDRFFRLYVRTSGNQTCFLFSVDGGRAL